MEVRQAIRYAIDRVSILENIYHIQNPTPLVCIFNNEALIPADLAQPYNYDPEKAKQLLADAGVDPASWGTIVFDTYYQDPGSLAAMTAIQANLADVGIQVQVQQMDSASWTDRYYGKGSEPGTSVMSMIGGDGGGAQAGYGRNSRDSRNPYPKGGNGWNGYHFENPEMDAAL